MQPELVAGPSSGGGRRSVTHTTCSSEGVRGADLVFACIGPAIEIYSRYVRVEDAEGREIPLGGDPRADAPHKRGFLAYVWETVGRIALQQVLGGPEAGARNNGAAALEEDARLTALFLQSAGRSNALRAFLKAETERGPEFLRLVNALSALYPKETEEKRLLDAMILVVPR